MQKVINLILDLLFPQTCMGCNKKGSILCDSCVYSIRRAERETNKDIVAIYDYRDPIIKRAIWNLKYYKQKYIGKILGQILYEAFIEDIADIKVLSGGLPIIVIPVPLSKTKKKTRGYNQAEIIANSFVNCAKNTDLELNTDTINKNIDTTPQARITNRNKRLRNVHGAFKILRPDLVIGRTFIIIDDVTTTGGTITEIIKILKLSKAKKVIGLAIAH